MLALPTLVVGLTVLASVGRLTLRGSRAGLKQRASARPAGTSPEIRRTSARPFLYTRTMGSYYYFR